MLGILPPSLMYRGFRTRVSGLEGEASASMEPLASVLEVVGEGRASEGLSGEAKSGVGLMWIEERRLVCVGPHTDMMALSRVWKISLL